MTAGATGGKNSVLRHQGAVCGAVRRARARMRVDATPVWSSIVKNNDDARLMYSCARDSVACATVGVR